MSKLEGRVAIVTGASKGIGAGIALRLAADGASVVVNYARSAEAAEKLVTTIRAAGGQAKAVQADVSQPAEINALFDKATAAFGHVDILVNNAGIYEFGDLASITPDSIDRQFGLNVKGLILATQAAARVFLPTGGVVVNISSGAGVTPIAQAQIYSATKGAVDNLTRSFALELGARRIRVVGVAPGLVATEGTSAMGEEGMAPFVARTPLGRVGQPADIAAAVAFVVSGDGSWITGETLQVGGGLRL
ncbi:glucose 1-dehydrogenase [Methylobacterium sp. J-072]|uniref:SDR family NAD(P)-dependent oxidoreductase n=1 Tax=Methylobacterium sp. J-072 TaxID=2836651 RepID=UPI001FBA0777|nr:glucose 1-dehydrogenase [Methylobacterium sp. J-072]MCJ2094307.1 glucose 1-dehydrogenase [Methylobacterium sp. J-072]